MVRRLHALDGRVAENILTLMAVDDHRVTTGILGVNGWTTGLKRNFITSMKKHVGKGNKMAISYFPPSNTCTRITLTVGFLCFQEHDLEI